MILNDSVIKSVLISQDYLIEGGNQLVGGSAEFNSTATIEMSDSQAGPKDIYEFYDKLDQDDVNANSKTKVYLLEIFKEQIEVLQKRCQEIDYPLLAEYDFKNDPNIPNIDIYLRPNATLRPYQEKRFLNYFYFTCLSLLRNSLNFNF